MQHVSVFNKPFSPFRNGVLGLLVVLSLSACSIWETDDWRDGGFDNGAVPSSVLGQRPIYARADAFDIFSDVTRPIQNGIAVFQEGDLLFTVDRDLGVHIVDNSDPRSPRPIVFIQVPGITTASATDNFLYVNNFEDFVTIDITDLQNAEVLDRQTNFYESPPDFPGSYRGFFECYDPARGPLRGWEEAVITEPQCRI